MTVLPIVVRELRVSARSKVVYRVRFWTAVAAVMFATYMMVVYAKMEFFGGAFSVGRYMFSLLSWIGFFYCAGLGQNTVDCVSEEKRDGTLGLLFLTDLKGYDVALGKLVSNSLKSFYAVLGTFPVLACSMTLGGVTGGEFWRTLLALMNLFFFSHTTGLLASTFSRKSRNSALAAATLLLVFCLGLPGLVELLIYAKYPAAAWVEWLSPLYSFNAATQAASPFGSHYVNYWTSLLLVHLTSWLFVGIASWRLPYCWQDKPVKKSSPLRARIGQLRYGTLAFRDALRGRLVAVNPFLWLVSRSRWGTVMPWVVVALMILGWGLGMYSFDANAAIGMFVPALLVNHFVFKIWIASEASVHLEEQRRNGALEFLLSCTPLSEKEIIEGQCLALRRRFLRPLIALAIVEAASICVAGRNSDNRYGDEIADFLMFAVQSLLMLGVDAWAISWVAMWRAMKEKQPRRAAGTAIFRIVVLPALIFFFFAMISGGFGESPAAVVIVWCFMGLGIDAGCGFSARDALHAEFRTLAGVQFEEPLGILGRLGRSLGQMARPEPR